MHRRRHNLFFSNANPTVPKLLVDLHMKLLRKIGKSVSAERWEKHLVKVSNWFACRWI
jgi:remodeling and spacing factor 1